MMSLGQDKPLCSSWTSTVISLRHISLVGSPFETIRHLPGVIVPAMASAKGGACVADAANAHSSSALKPAAMRNDKLETLYMIMFHRTGATIAYWLNLCGSDHQWINPETLGAKGTIHTNQAVIADHFGTIDLGEASDDAAYMIEIATAAAREVR